MEVGGLSLQYGYDAVVLFLAEVYAGVESAAVLGVEAVVACGGVLAEGDEAGGEPPVGFLGPGAEHLPAPPAWVAHELVSDHVDYAGGEGAVGGHGFGVWDGVGAEPVRGFVDDAVEDAVGVPWGALGDDDAVCGVYGEEDGCVEVRVVADEVHLHEVDGFGGVASYGLGDGGLSEDGGAVPEPYHGLHEASFAADGVEEGRVVGLHPVEVVAERLEGDAFDLAQLGGGDQQGGAGVPEGEVEELGHPVEGLARLAGHEEGHEVAPVPEEGADVRVGLVVEPLPAERDGVRGQGPAACSRGCPAPRVVSRLPQAP